MSTIRNSIEKWFEQFAHILYHNRIKTILFMLAIIATMISQIPKITIDTSTGGFLHEKDPALTAYNFFRDQFGRDQIQLLARISYEEFIGLHT